MLFRSSFTNDASHDDDASKHGHSHASSGCCGAPYGCGADAGGGAMYMQDPSGSYDEEAFIAEAGFSGDSGDAMPETRGPKVNRGPNGIERALTAFYRATGVGWIADKLKGNVAVCAVSWFFLIVGGVAQAIQAPDGIEVGNRFEVPRDHMRI